MQSQHRFSCKGPSTWLIVVLLVAVLSCAGQGTGRAQPVESIDPESYLNLQSWQPGFPVALSGSYLIWGSSPTLVDLDGDGTLEVVVGGRNRKDNGQPGCSGWVYAYRHNGTLMWQKPVRAPINSTPTAADLNGDGHPDIIAGMGGIVEGQCWNGGVVALNGLDGSELWTFDTQDWLNHNPDGMLDGVFSTPAVGDVNGDGEIEIVFGSWDQCLYLLNKGGVPLWGNLPGILPQVYCGGHGFYNEDTFWSSPALADLTGDGLPEIITGADVYVGNVWGDPTGGYLYVFDAAGNTLAREWIEQDIYSSPAVADLDNDGANEVVVGTGLFRPGEGYFVSAFEYDPNPANPKDRLVRKWRQTTVGRVFSSPALGDLNKDGWLDVVSVVPIGDNGATGTVVYALRGYDGTPLFQRQIYDPWGNSFNTLSSAIVTDIDGDTWPEILFSHAWEVAALNHDGTFYTDYTYYAGYTLYATPAVGDLDGDGDAEVVIGGHNPDNPNQGMLFAWTGHPVDERPSWPTWRQNERHTGFFLFDTIPPSNPTGLSSPSHTPGVWSTSNQVQVVWSGAADDKSGVAGYSVVWDTVSYTLPDAVVDLPAEVTTATSPPLADGKNHYFHLRTADNAGNWAAGAVHLGPFWIDTTRPQSYASSPSLVKGSFLVSWQGSDAASGLVDYTIQVRQNDGPWTIWKDHQTGTSATYSGTEGSTYRFRSIAHDLAGHTETDYTQQGDTSTVVARYLLSGNVYDHRGRPVPGAVATAQPVALNQAAAGIGGQYTLGLLNSGAYDVSASHPLYGMLPPRYGVAVNGDVQDVDFYLPPTPNYIQNGNFEAEGGWELNGPVPPVRAQGESYTGVYALMLGVQPTGLASSRSPFSAVPLEDSHQEKGPASEPWAWTADQEISVPVNGQATLAWIYRVDGNVVSGDSLSVAVDGPASVITYVLSLDAETWTHGWLDVSDFAGQQVVVRFVLSRESPAGPLDVWLDDVSEGVVPYRVYLPAVSK